MTKFHINSKGEPGACKARTKCPFGSIETDHFPTEVAAREAYESRMSKAEMAIVKLNVYAYKTLPNANFVASTFQVKDEEGSLHDFDSLRAAVDYSQANGKLEIIGVTQPAVETVAPPVKKNHGTIFNDYIDHVEYESSRGPWEYNSNPSIEGPKAEYHRAIKNYWKENFEFWNTAWLNPDEAEGVCTESSEDFAQWASDKGFRTSVLELQRASGPHTVTVVHDKKAGDTVVDFTNRQFDSESSVPFSQSKDQFLEDGGWKVLEENSY